jgi:hypothetical protein
MVSVRRDFNLEQCVSQWTFGFQFPLSLKTVTCNLFPEISPGLHRCKHRIFWKRESRIKIYALTPMPLYNSLAILSSLCTKSMVSLSSFTMPFVTGQHCRQKGCHSLYAYCAGVTLFVCWLCRREESADAAPTFQKQSPQHLTDVCHAKGGWIREVSWMEFTPWPICLHSILFPLTAVFLFLNRLPGFVILWLHVRDVENHFWVLSRPPILLG